MKVLISIVIALLVVGCGESAEERMAKEAAKLRATAEANRKANPPPKGLPKPFLTEEESADIIEGAIRHSINKPTGELTKADLEKVTELAFGGGLQFNVKGLEKLTQLEGLSIFQNQLTDVKGLEKLTQLKELDLSVNHLSNVKDLEKLVNLQELNLADNQLTDVKGLGKLTQLKYLDLGGNKLTDVKGLEKLTQLTELNLHGNELTDVKGLEKLTELTSLKLRANFDLTETQIAELQKALPKCIIIGP